LARPPPGEAARRGGPAGRPGRPAPSLLLPGALLARAGGRRPGAAVRGALRPPRRDRRLRPPLRGRLAALDRRLLRHRRRGGLVGPLAPPRVAPPRHLDLRRLRPLLLRRAAPRPAPAPPPAARRERSVPAPPLARPPLFPGRRPARPGRPLGSGAPPGDPER